MKRFSVITPWTKWTAAEVRELRRLASSKSLFKREIAEKLGKNTQQVSHMLRRLGLTYRPVGRIGQWNAKHKHLREPVMHFFMTHSREETAKHFGLSLSEVNSCITYGYADPRLKSLRKDRRTHRPWKSDDWKFMAAHAGLMPRGWIAKKLGRSKEGRYHVVKERLGGAGVGSRYLNGLTHTLAHGLLPDVAFVSILTQAGSRGCWGNTQARIVPWVMLEDLTRSRRIDPIIRDGIRAMARFQRWIHGAKSNGEAMDAITSILQGTPHAKRSTET